ncbi:TPA: shikimate dehydrogenase family protein [Raoultella planticola]|nr:hypothetical protein [Klebsiella pneumoniae]
MNTSINGSTRVYMMLGHPIAQVRSPTVINEMFHAHGINAVLIGANVAPEDLTTTVSGLMKLENLDGLLVTIPHKTAMLAFADRILPSSERTGATNALRREKDGSWSADMFDGSGFVNALHTKGLSVRGKRVRLYGAGGAGMAIAVALADAGAAHINLIDLDRQKSGVVARYLQQSCPDCVIDNAVESYDTAQVIVNASPVGMKNPTDMPEILGELHMDTLVGDVIIRQQPTALLAHAARFGCETVSGEEMHVGQMNSLFEFFGFRV